MKYTLASVLLAFTLFVSAQDKPDWLKQRPVTGLNYVGIGMASKNGTDYVQKAKQKALSDLVSEIKVEVQSSSLLNTIEDHGQVRSRFEEAIRLSAKEEIQGYRMIGVWEDENEYWVYYELNKYDYDDFLKARREKAVKEGFGYWYKGQVALQEGHLQSAAELFTKGLEVIQPAINQDLSCSYEEKVINVGQELYASLMGLFDGMAITTSVGKIEAEAFRSVEPDLAACLSKNGVALANMKLKVTFVSGSGDLSQPTLTDQTGTSMFRINNITSKQSNQQVRIALDTDFLKNLQQGIYASLYSKLLSEAPEVMIDIVLKNAKVAAYVEMKDNHIQPLEQTVKSILATNYFDVVADASMADVTVTLSTEFFPGQPVKGELYNMVECFSSMSLQLVDNRTGRGLLDYSVSRLRTLVPSAKSVAQAKQMATRELMKRVQRELKMELQKIHIDTSGDLPGGTHPETEEPKSVPTPVVIPVPVPQPVVVDVPVTKQPRPEAPVAIKGELDSGVYLEYVKITHLSGKSMVHFVVRNTTSDDYKLSFYLNRLVLVNQNGEEQKVEVVTIGGTKDTYQMNALIVPDIPTKMVVETGKLESVALFGLTCVNGRNVKLRNLK